LINLQKSPALPGSYFLSPHAREIKILKTVDKRARLVYNHYVKMTLTERVALVDMQSESGMV
jgi:hypothetical protein